MVDQLAVEIGELQVNSLNESMIMTSSFQSGWVLSRRREFGGSPSEHLWVTDAPAPAVTYAAPAQVVIERIVEIPENQAVPKLPESLGTAPVCQMQPAESVEVVEFGPPLPDKSPPVFMTAPVVGVPLVVVEYVQPAPVVEYVAPAPVMTYAAPAQERIQQHTVEHSCFMWRYAR